MFRSAATKIAHNSTIPALGGNKDLRLLQELITSEKAILQTLLKLSADFQRASEALKNWGMGEGEDLSDTLLGSNAILSHFSHALAQFASHEEGMRSHMKAVRSREEALDELKRRRRSVASKADSAEKKLSKMGPENKNIIMQTDMLNRLRDEIRQLDSEIMTEEAKLGDFKRASAKEWMALKFGGLQELSEKGTIIGEFGKLIINIIPQDPTQPGLPRAFYNGHAQTERLIGDAQQAISSVAFVAAPSLNKPDFTRSRTNTLTTIGDQSRREPELPPPPMPSMNDFRPSDMNSVTSVGSGAAGGSYFATMPASRNYGHFNDLSEATVSSVASAPSGAPAPILPPPNEFGAFSSPDPRAGASPYASQSLPASHFRVAAISNTTPRSSSDYLPGTIARVPVPTYDAYGGTEEISSPTVPGSAASPIQRTESAGSIKRKPSSGSIKRKPSGGAGRFAAFPLQGARPRMDAVVPESPGGPSPIYSLNGTLNDDQTRPSFFSDLGTGGGNNGSLSLAAPGMQEADSFSSSIAAALQLDMASEDGHGKGEAAAASLGTQAMSAPRTSAPSSPTASYNYSSYNAPAGQQPNAGPYYAPPQGPPLGSSVSPSSIPDGSPAPSYHMRSPSGTLASALAGIHAASPPPQLSSPPPQIQPSLYRGGDIYPEGSAPGTAIGAQSTEWSPADGVRGREVPRSRRLQEVQDDEGETGLAYMSDGGSRGGSRSGSPAPSVGSRSASRADRRVRFGGVSDGDQSAEGREGGQQAEQDSKSEHGSGKAESDASHLQPVHVDQARARTPEMDENALNAAAAREVSREMDSLAFKPLTQPSPLFAQRTFSPAPRSSSLTAAATPPVDSIPPPPPIPAQYVQPLQPQSVPVSPTSPPRSPTSPNSSGTPFTGSPTRAKGPLPVPPSINLPAPRPSFSPSTSSGTPYHTPQEYPQASGPSAPLPRPPLGLTNAPPLPKAPSPLASIPPPPGPSQPGTPALGGKISIAAFRRAQNRVPSNGSDLRAPPPPAIADTSPLSFTKKPLPTSPYPQRPAAPLSSSLPPPPPGAGGGLDVPQNVMAQDARVTSMAGSDFEFDYISAYTHDEGEAGGHHPGYVGHREDSGLM